MSSNMFSSRLLQEAASIARGVVARDGTRIRWATVTSVNPPRIRYDGESSPSIVSPQTVTSVKVGQRVAVAKHKGQALIIGASGGAGAVALGDRSLSGSAHVGNNRFTIPSDLQGGFSRYELILSIGISGMTSIRAISAWFNGDADASYRSFGNWIGDAEGTYSSNATAFPRTGYAHSQVGSMRINIIPAFTSSDWVYWDATGYWNPGTAVGGTFSTGGRWNGPSAGSGRITSINFGSTVAADTWTSNSRAYLRGYR